MRRYAWAIVAAAVFSGVSCNDALEDREVFQAVLSGSEESRRAPPPPTAPRRSTSTATASATAIKVDDITSITAAHIHSGAPGVNGSIRLFLYPVVQGTPAPQVTTTDRGILVEATVPSSNVNGVTYQESR